MTKKVKFRGIPSGDHEAFCWDVSAKEYKRLMGEKPPEYARSFFHKNCHRVYEGVSPDFDMGIPSATPSGGCLFDVEIIVTETEKEFMCVLKAKKIKKVKSIK